MKQEYELKIIPVALNNSCVLWSWSSPLLYSYRTSFSDRETTSYPSPGIISSSTAVSPQFASALTVKQSPENIQWFSMYSTNRSSPKIPVSWRADVALFLLPVASSCSNVACADQIGLSRRRRYPSKQEEDRDTMQGTALCCFVDSSERCRANRDMGGGREKSYVWGLWFVFLYASG